MQRRCDVNHPVAIVFVDPWNCLFLAIAVVLLLVSVYSLWRRTGEARLMAALEEQLADIYEQAGHYQDAAHCLGRAQRWRRLAWPRRRTAKTAGEAT